MAKGKPKKVDIDSQIARAWYQHRLLDLTPNHEGNAPMTTCLQYLTLAEAKARCRDAWCRKELSAQSDPGDKGCQYITPGGYSCAIGVNLNPDMLDWVTQPLLTQYTIRNNCAVRILVLEGVLDTDDQLGLMRLQRLHDEMSTSAKWSGRISTNAKAKFLAFIYS